MGEGTTLRTVLKEKFWRSYENNKNIYLYYLYPLIHFFIILFQKYKNIECKNKIYVCCNKAIFYSVFYCLISSQNI